MSNRHLRRAQKSAPASAVLLSILFAPEAADAQTATSSQPLPQVVVTAPKPLPIRPPRRRVTTPPPVRTAAPVTPVAPVAVDDRSIPSGAAGTPPGGSLTAPTTAQVQRELARTPGAVTVVPSEAFRNTTPATTIKDALDYVAGVYVQPKWGEDSRLSIRGSGLSRNFHLRGVQLYMDGIPINTADGYGDFQELDPSAYRHIEVYKGGNALRFGANAMGGAINFVTPSGRDASVAAGAIDVGSFGFFRMQASSGAAKGPLDYFVTASLQRQDGFRNHSNGQSERGSANIGYQITPDIETRFYFNASHIRQRIPGSVTKSIALNAPETAAAINVTNDYQRNIDSVRVANKTTMRFGPTTLELGIFGLDRHLMHPIFQWIDYKYTDYGAFARVTDDRQIGGFRNRLIAGVNLHNGVVDADQFANTPGAVKGAPTSRTKDKSGNLSAYLEDSFYFLPDVALVAGTQFLHATRDRTVLQGPAIQGSTEFNLWSPKLGVLWEIDPTWQAFANISRSAEVPSFGESAAVQNISFLNIKPQRATTFEIGTRGRRPDVTWDFGLYRAEIKNELMCLYGPNGSCNVTNADKTVHQGIEAAFGATLLKSIFVDGPAPDRLWLNLAYTFNDFFFKDDALFGNNVLPGAPRHYVRAELLYKHPSGFYFGPNVEWVPEAYFVDSSNTLKTEPYALLGLKAGYDTKHVSFYIEGRNLADTAYIASASITNLANPNSALFEPGTGRAVFIGIRGKL